jgi:RecJ-like exonuclease
MKQIIKETCPRCNGTGEVKKTIYDPECGFCGRKGRMRRVGSKIESGKPLRITFLCEYCRDIDGLENYTIIEG